MSNIEDEIVSMKFDNRQFESGVATSIGSLDKLKSALQFQNAGTGLTEANRAVGRFNMDPMSKSIEGVSKMWLGLTTVAVTAISNITNKVIDAGLRIGKSLVIDPVKQGFSEYQTNLKSIQTIMANTGAKLPVVNDALAVLNEYADKTIYNFSQMAENIGRFTAAGVKIGPATDAIKGMANTAALTGASAEDLNRAMYQMSQAMSSGTIRLMDYKSLENANMGTLNVRKAIMATAHSMEDGGKAMDEGIAKFGNFRDSLQTGWLSADIFAKTMKVMSGTTNEAGDTVAFTVKQLQKMGYSRPAAQELNKLSAAAIDSATKVKTVSQAYDVVKESIGSGWAKVFQNLFGDFKQSTKLWTSVTDTITTAIDKVFDAINAVLGGWNDQGGFLLFWQALGNIFKTIGNLLSPFVTAWKAIFDAGEAGDGLYKATVGFEAVTAWMEKTSRGAKKLTPIIMAVFGFFKEGASQVKNLAQELAPLVGIFEQVGGKIEGLSQQGFDIAKGIIDGMLEGLNANNLQAAIVEFAQNIVIWIKDTLGIHSPAAELIPVGYNIAAGIAEGIGDGVKKIIEVLKNVFTTIGQWFMKLAEGVDAEEALAIINTGFFIAFYLAAARFFRSFGGLIGEGRRVMKSIGGVFNQLTDNLKTMQNKVRSEIIRNIAISVGILAVSALLLSTVDGKKLAISLGAIVGMMTALLAAMGIVAKGSKGMDAKSIAKQTGLMLGLSTAMIAFATAILIMATAVALIGQLDQDTLNKGLEGVGAIVVGLTAATAIMARTGGGATILAAAAALLVMSVALTAFAGVMKLYATMDWQTIAVGGGIAAVIIIGLGLAMRAFGQTALPGAAALLIASAALFVLGGVMEKLAKIPFEDLLKAVLALSALMVVMGATANMMELALPGAQAMLVMAGAILVMAKALEILAKIPFLDLLKGVLIIALLFTVIGVATAILTPIIPFIAALGVALLLLGAAMFLAGTGMALFAGGLAVLATVGTAGFAVLTAGIMSIVGLLPLIAQQFGLAIVAWAVVIGEKAPIIVDALDKLFDRMMEKLIGNIPTFGRLLVVMIQTGLQVIRDLTPNFVKTGFGVIIAFLEGLRKNIKLIADMGVEIGIRLIDAIGSRADELVAAAGRLIERFAKAIGRAAVKVGSDLLDDGKQMAADLVTGLTGYLWDQGMALIRNAAEAIAGALPGWMKKVLGIDSPSKVMRDEVGRWAAVGVADGLDKHSKDVQKSSEDLANKSLQAMKYTFRNAKDTVDGMGDLQPKITPILDLTQLEREASQIGGALSGQQTIDTRFARSQAQDIASAEAARRIAEGEIAASEEYNFYQTINSPKAVNAIDAYRGTKSQIALFREVKSS